MYKNRFGVLLYDCWVLWNLKFLHPHTTRSASNASHSVNECLSVIKRLYTTKYICRGFIKGQRQQRVSGYEITFWKESLVMTM